MIKKNNHKRLEVALYSLKNIKHDSDRAIKESRARRDERHAIEWEEKTGMNAHRMSDISLPHMLLAVGVSAMMGLQIVSV